MQIIKDISFTDREFDVIACLLNSRGVKKIADILLISSRTVEVHIQNIKTKIGVNSQDNIIDFVENSEELSVVKQHYLNLLITVAFQQKLRTISKLTRQKPSCIIIYYSKSSVIDFLLKHLKLSGIEVIVNPKNLHSNNDYILYVLSKNSMNKTSINNIISKYAETKNLTFLILDDEDNHVNPAQLANSTQLPNINIINFCNKEQYYLNVFKILKPILRNIDLNKFISEFKTLQKNIVNFNISTKELLHDSQDNDEQITLADDELNCPSDQQMSRDHSSIIGKNKIFFISAILLIMAISIVLYYNFFPTTKFNISEINQGFAKFAQEFVADSITSEKIKQKNYDLLDEVEKLVSHFDDNDVEKYFTSNHVTQVNLLNSIYVLHALANHYTYNRHDGSNALKMLFRAKNIAEKYIENKNKLQINFDQLNADELYNEFIIVDDLVQMYTRILYMIGRSYIILGNLNQSLQYFQTSSILGNKLNLFEGFMSIRNGIEFIKNIEIEEHTVNGEFDIAKSKILKSIKAFELLIHDNKEYIINYLPKASNKETIIPAQDIYNKVYCTTRFLKNYSKIIAISKNQQESMKYIDKVSELLFPMNSVPIVLSAKITPKMSAYFHNGLGNTIFTIYDKGFDYTYLKTKLQSYLNLNNASDLEIIEQIFKIAQDKSRNVDFTKADSYEGLIKVYNKYLERENIDQEKKQIFLDKIQNFTIQKDTINKELKRTGWQTEFN